MNREILHIAIPSIISNITVPLLGLISTGIVGHLGETAYLAAIALGTMFFNVVYWVFAFLRMGASGLTAQAYGKKDSREIAAVLAQSVAVALLIAIALIATCYPIERLIFSLLNTTLETEHYASAYIRILIWGAPAQLLLYSIHGWFIGMQNSRYQVYVVVAMNVVCIALSFLFVYKFGMTIDGVAYAGVVSLYFGLAVALLLWAYKYRGFYSFIHWRKNLRLSEMHRFFTINRDVFLRMVCLVAVTFYFVYAGAKQGDIILAVNTLMMQLYYLYSFFIDGFALAGEALVGKYAGAGDELSMRETVKRLFLWGTAMAVIFTAFYGIGGKHLLNVLTDDSSVTAAAAPYFYWALIMPLASYAAFIWDGIMIGAVATRYMLIAIAVASAVFFGVYYSFGADGNHVLWLAFVLYLITRGGVQTLFAKRTLRIYS
ncbi:MAG: MATE family efflux transporter [Prevotellaceae bacterium]|jgi:MATE family multidrug resistance protein|nr:MATE family efflux transporter [Prevotellaceae bacterium]